MNTSDYYSFIKNNIEGMHNFANKDELKDFVVNELGIPSCVDGVMQIMPDVFEHITTIQFIMTGGLRRLTDTFCNYFGELTDERVDKELRKKIHDIVCFHFGTTATICPGPTCY